MNEKPDIFPHQHTAQPTQPVPTPITDRLWRQTEGWNAAERLEQMTQLARALERSGVLLNAKRDRLIGRLSKP